ncbi:CBS domain-containing protein [Kaistia soli DSM 19436]|uniref:CBS domain-containing protein n=1 Tax=Kaistia soli DSM 19436 TaxID=1122133 RepID=A0A1M5DCT0_9HYPH|nr:hemolysin family protein [Kaistia soli]SHF64654.1 CBS domain-containing protein [Kaistia soli DSM 19436]
MTDTDTPGTGAENAQEPPSISAFAPDSREGEKTSESWFDRLRHAVGFKPTGSLREEMEEALEGDGAATAFTAEERLMLRNILKLRDVRVDDVMVPRADILALDVDMTLGGVIGAFRESGHSRMPAYRESLDDPVGMVHIKDLMDLITGAAMANGDIDFSKVDLSLKLADTEIIRSVLFVPPSMPAATLLSTMQASHVQMAVVIDEYGGTDGLVSLEDVVEIVFGEIEDEHDEDEAPLITPEADGTFLADARADLEELEAALGMELGLGDGHDDVDTIGGLVFTLLGRIPQAGERIALPDGLAFEILESDQRRVKRLRVSRENAAAA